MSLKYLISKELMKHFVAFAWTEEETVFFIHVAIRSFANHVEIDSKKRQNIKFVQFAGIEWSILFRFSIVEIDQ